MPEVASTINQKNRSMFVLPDGKNVLFTFCLVSSLFLLWGVCNGLIDTMDKHFQEELHLTLSQSASVQFAHYLGYFVMSMVAGWLATKLGYKGGIIAGLLLVAAGGFWFVPATKIAAFWAFLLGVCAIAAGLTFLETVANPYTTVLGDPRYAATRINLAQSCNGIGWILGPIIASIFFYSKDATGQSTGSQTLYIPYLIIAIVVIVLSVIFFFADVPDVKSEDDYHLDDNGVEVPTAVADRQVNRGLTYFMLLLNAVALVLIGGQTVVTVMIIAGKNSATASNAITIVEIVASLILVLALIPIVRKLSHRSVWSHPHFSGATLAQFLYVAAQAGIFSFFINYMTSEVPPIPAAWRTETTRNWIEVRTGFLKSDIEDFPAFAARLKQSGDPVSTFLNARLAEGTKTALAAFNDANSDHKTLKALMIQDLNKIVKQDPKKTKKEDLLHDAQRFAGVKLSDATRELAAKNPEGEELARLNRMLLEDAYPRQLTFKASLLGLSDKFAALLASVAFGFFLIGRFTGAGLLKKLSAHRLLGLYGLLNVIVCGLIMLKLGWFSVICVFLSYLFMSIMFPTIFALGIFGLGERAKKASAFIVMAIMGGGVFPKLMGHVGDQYDMSIAFIVPLCCFAFVSFYGFAWPKFSKADSLHGVGTSGGH